MQIRLEDLPAKRIKSNTDFQVSDHTITFLKPCELVISGKGTRGLVFNKTKECRIIFRDAVINMSSDGVAIKANGGFQDSSIEFENSQIYAKPGGVGSQIIYFIGEFNKNMTVIMDDRSFLDGGRTDAPGDTKGGAAFQVASSYTAACNATNWSMGYFRGNLNIRRANDEGGYWGYYAMTVKDVSYPPTGFDEVDILGMTVEGSGREYAQITNSKKVRINKLTGRAGSLEKHNDHWSGISINGGCPDVEISNCDIREVAQPIYFGSYGVKGYAVIRDCHLEQRKDYYAPSAVYLKGPIDYLLENNKIIPVKIAVTADAAEVSYKACDLQADDFRYFNSAPKAIELASIKTYEQTILVKEETIGSVTTTRYFMGETELIKKP